MADSTIDQIKKELDIVDIVAEHVDLAKKGRNFWGLCPFHEDSNPSMSVSPDKQLFKCFVCGAGGDLIKFTADINKVTFPKALNILGQRIGLDIQIKGEYKPTYDSKQQELIDVLKDAMEFYQYSLSTENGAKALAYSEERGLNIKIREEFLIGYAPSSGLLNFLEKKGHDKSVIINASLLNSYESDFFRDRLIFGLTNQHGDVVGFSARDLSGSSTAKYINSGDTRLFSKSSLLYNYANAKESIKRESKVYINEGFMDVIAMHRAGIHNSVAIMGTALTKEHISLLKGRKVVLMLDADKAGVAATIKSIKLLLDNNITTLVVNNESEDDPDEILKTKGIEGLREVALDCIEAIEFVYSLHRSKYKNITPTTALEFIVSFSKYLSNASDIAKDFYITKMSVDLNLSKDIISSKVLGSKRVYSPSTPKKSPVKTMPSEPYKPHVRVYYRLMKSIFGKKHLAQQVRQSNVVFGTIMEKQIANYIIDFTLGKKSAPPESFKEEFAKISEVKNVFTTEDEIKDVVKKINRNTRKLANAKYNVKLKDKTKSNSEESTLKMLEGLKKLRQTNREEEDK